MATGERHYQHLQLHHQNKSILCRSVVQQPAVDLSNRGTNHLGSEDSSVAGAPATTGIDASCDYSSILGGLNHYLNQNQYAVIAK